MKTRAEIGLRRKTVWTRINDAGEDPIELPSTIGLMMLEEIPLNCPARVHERTLWSRVCLDIRKSLEHRLVRFCKGQ